MLSNLALVAFFASISCVLGDFTTTCTGQLKSPRPPEKYCGSRGTIKSPSATQTEFGYTFADCRDACLTAAATTCTSFTFGLSRGKCVFYNKPLAQMSYNTNQINRGVVNYNRNCFTRTCTTTCSLDEGPQTAPNDPNNLIPYPDGSFEGTNGQGNWMGAAEIFRTECDESGFPYDGQHYAALVKAAAISYDINVPDTSTSITFRYRVASRGNSTGDLNVVFFYGTYQGFVSVATGNAVMDSYASATVPFSFNSTGTNNFGVLAGADDGDEVDVDYIVIETAD